MVDDDLFGRHFEEDVNYLWLEGSGSGWMHTRLYIWRKLSSRPVGEVLKVWMGKSNGVLKVLGSWSASR